MTHDAPDAFWHSLHAVGLLRRPEHHVHFRYVVARGRSLHPPRRRDGHIQLVAPNCCPPPLALSISNGFVCTERMRTDQIAELEIMLEDHSVSGVLEALADCLERKAHGATATRSWALHATAYLRTPSQSPACRRGPPSPSAPIMTRTHTGFTSRFGPNGGGCVLRRADFALTLAGLAARQHPPQARRYRETH